MASPEVERPMTSPSHPPGGYPRPHARLSNSGEKKKTLNIRSFNKYGSFQPKSSQVNTFRRNPSNNTASTVSSRKRSYSFSEGHSKSISVPPSKRWKRSSGKEKFHLGGNIRDPLNLNSLSDDKVAQVLQDDSGVSPIPTPKHKKPEYKIEVLIPPNISDPLNLMRDDNDDEYDASFNKKKTRPRKRNHARKLDPESPKEIKKVRFEAQDSNVNKESVIPKPQILMKDMNDFKEEELNVETSSDDIKPKFQYGNYNRYYGYRLEGSDPRFRFFDPDWFRGKDVLDIGCNVGEVTMSIARDMAPKSIFGLDIDNMLISKARKLLKQYANTKVPSAMATPNPGVEISQKKTEQLFPQSLPMIFGPLDPATTTATSQQPCQPYPQPQPPALSSILFPNNIKFLCDNYVLESDDLLEFSQPEFDTILCLSTTKWLHLNFGDDGLKRAFKRMFAQLRPYGTLILEPQGLASYSKKARKINAVTKDNFNNMKFKPNQFVEYLINDVGFSGGEIIGTPQHSALGFRRAIYVFKKP